MDIEFVEIRDFLAAHHPFDLLPVDALNGIVRSIQIRYLRKGAVVMAPGDRVEHLYQVRTGAIETRDPALPVAVSVPESASALQVDQPLIHALCPPIRFAIGGHSAVVGRGQRCLLM